MSHGRGAQNTGLLRSSDCGSFISNQSALEGPLSRRIDLANTL
jgi:hypothetical protein